LTVKRRIEAMPDESSNAAIDALLDFWFEDSRADPDPGPALMRKWFGGSADHDRDLGERLGAWAERAAAGDLDHWSATARGRLALILLLDQLPRNLHRGTAAAFAEDSKALALCLDGIELGQDKALNPLERIFFLMPLQHAESRETQARSTTAFRQLSTDNQSEALQGFIDNSATSAIEHHEIVDRFGRFPHRNRVLGRESTDEEVEFLKSGGPSFGQ
jgi:uncharacterized protein (DUF924 family)